MALQRIYDRPHPFRRYVPVVFALFWVEMRAIFQLVLAGCRKTVLQTAVRIVKKRKPLSTIKTQRRAKLQEGALHAGYQTRTEGRAYENAFP